MKILVTDYAWRDLEIERNLFAPLSAQLVAAKTGEEDELFDLAADADGILTNWKRVSRKVIANAPKCQAIVRYGVGLDNIDVQFATQVGIIVANVPYYCIEEVSDHTLALLFSLARKVAHYDRGIKSGIYDLASGTPMYRLRGKTLGLLGFGSMAKMVCRKAQALGLQVIVCRRSKSSADLGDGVRQVDFNELLRESDFVSLHVPLVPETRRLFNREAFLQMKKTAFLINTARGDVMDAQALLHALEEGQIAGAALDVFSKEPPDLPDPLLSHPKTIVTPHAAFNSEESLEELRKTASEQMLAVLRGGVPEYFVNREVAVSPNLRARCQSTGAIR
jgi:D-3-phosphoglycerate dehydrogenase